MAPIDPVDPIHDYYSGTRSRPPATSQPQQPATDSFNAVPLSQQMPTSPPLQPLPPVPPPENGAYDLSAYTSAPPANAEPYRQEYANAGLETAAVAGGATAGAYMANSEKPKGRSAFFRTRRRMYCCLCCGIALILLAIMLPVGVFVIVPAVAQSAINGSKMTITSANITAPNEDGFTMKMSGMVTDTGPFDAQIEFTKPVKIMAGNVELGTVKLPPIASKAGVGAVLDSTAPFTVTNKEAFGKFAKTMLTSESFSWTMSGEAAIHAMGLTLNGIKVIKDLPFKGMNNFPKVDILSFDLPGNHPDGGIQLKVESSLLNPSPIGMEVGDMYFDMVYNDVKVGEVMAQGITLNAGTNTVTMEGRLIPLNSTQDLATLSEMMSKYMKGETAMVSVVGTNVKPNNNTAPITWLLQGFKGTKMTIAFPGAKDLKVVTGVKIGSMGMIMTPATAYNPLTSGKGVVATFKMPFNFPLSMQKITQNITVSDDAGTEFATLSVPWTGASGTSESGRLETAFSDVRMNVMKGKESTFEGFIYKLSTTPTAVMKMSAVAAAVAKTAVGDLTIDGMKFSDGVPLIGMNGLKGTPVEIKSIIVKGGTRQAIEIGIVVSMPNPANVGISVGRVEYNAYFQQEKIGVVVIPNMVLNPGPNTVQSTMYFSPQTPQAKAVGRKLMSGYLQGVSARVGMGGEPATVTAIQSLKKALSAIKIETTMPGLTGVEVMRGAYFGVDVTGTLLRQIAHARFDAYNPLDATIKFLKMDAEMFFQGQSVGVISHDLRDDPLVIPAKTVVSSKRFDLKIKLSLPAIKLFIEALKDELKVDVKSVIVAAVGDYEMTIDFAQNGVTSRIG